MHRVRQNVNYFEQLGWKATVVSVLPKYVETGQDQLLLHSIPTNLQIFQIKAFSTSWTRKLGLGALALRSLLFYFFKVNSILKSQTFDLIFFSTTQFPVLILGRYWKWRFGVPYIIDMQDPWHSDFYRNKPKSDRPPKYWFSYNLNKFLEPIAMKSVAGIIAVSQGYCEMLQKRYKNITPSNFIVIPFGAFEKDFEIASRFESLLNTQNLSKNANPSKAKITYVGRGGADMQQALTIIFGAFQLGLHKDFELFSHYQLQFIGTSYAAAGKGIKTIEPLAIKLGLKDYVTEITDRIPYFESLHLLKKSDLLLVPGSTDSNYTASKLYPYILSKKPILAVFSKTSSVVEILEKTKAGEFITFDAENIDLEMHILDLYQIWRKILLHLPFEPNTNWEAFASYTAFEMTKKQVLFFEKTLNFSKN